jgi:hypothetical protein
MSWIGFFRVGLVFSGKKNHGPYPPRELLRVKNYDSYPPVALVVLDRARFFWAGGLGWTGRVVHDHI